MPDEPAIEQQVVGNLQCSRKKERHVDELGPGEEQPGEYRGDGRAHGSDYAGNARCRGPLFRSDHRHCTWIMHTIRVPSVWLARLVPLVSESVGSIFAV